MAELLNEKQYYMYKGKPLLRENNTICYGSMADKYVLFLLILSDKEVLGEDGKKEMVPDKIIVQILTTDTSKQLYERVVKTAEKTGLYDAMDIGINWLDMMNNAK